MTVYCANGAGHSGCETDLTCIYLTVVIGIYLTVVIVTTSDNVYFLHILFFICDLALYLVSENIYTDLSNDAFKTCLLTAIWPR